MKYNVNQQLYKYNTKHYFQPNDTIKFVESLASDLTYNKYENIFM